MQRALDRLNVYGLLIHCSDSQADALQRKGSNMKSNLNSKSFKWLNAVQFLGALNDNIFKFFIIFFLIGLFGPQHAHRVNGLAGVFFVIPFLLFTPFAGVLADRLSKRNIIVFAKVLEFFVMGIGLLAFMSRQEWLLYGTLFLMSTQSAIFGPSKLGIIPELVSKDRLSRANSLMVMFTFLAIVLGSALAPFIGEWCGKDYAVAQRFCIGLAGVGAIVSFLIHKTPSAKPEQKVTLFPYRSIWQALWSIRNDKFLMMAVIASAYFTLLGAFMQMNLIAFGIQHLGLTQERSGYLFLLAAVGIAVGSFLAGKMSGRNIEFGIVPLGALFLTISCAVLNLVKSTLGAVAPVVFLAGVGAGLFVVPLDSFIQFQAPHKQLGKILAASGFLSWIGVLIASGLVLLLPVLHVTAAEGFLLMGIMTLVLTIVSIIVLPDFLLRFLVLVITRLAYRIKVVGREHVPVDGPALLVCNHVSYVDALLLIATQQRRIRFMMATSIYERWAFARMLFRLMGCIPIEMTDSPKKILRSLKQARAAMDDGYMVCIFAEGQLTRTGTLREFNRGFERIVKGTDYPVIPVYLGGAWGSIYSYYHGQLLRRWPTLLRYPVSIHFGKPMPGTSSVVEVRQAVMELSCDYFNERKKKHPSLQRTFVREARKRWHESAIADSAGTRMSYGKTLIASLLLANKLKASIGHEQNVGILLPPSVGAALSNLAVAFLNKCAVNINFTASPEAIHSAIQQCRMKYIITSSVFLKKIGELDLPPTGELIRLEEVMRELKHQRKWTVVLKALFAPARWMTGRGVKADDVATIIFSSGSTAEPKGIMLSHHNILSNIEAERMVFKQSPRDHLCAALPFFHSLGYTTTFWYPLLSGFPVTYHPNPLDAAGIVKIVKEQHSTMLFATPTFLSLYMRKASAEDFASLEYVVVGAERMKESLADAFEKKYGVHPLEGYGATELSPVATLSLPHINVGDVEQKGWKGGSVGMPLPGVAVKIVDPDTMEPLPSGESGLLLVKGPNVMVGYLNQPEKTTDVIHDGWYNTGDIARIDEDGFVAITDRLSRFSKIGGEMVPHVAVEEELQKLAGMEERMLAVTAVRDEKKGERLVVLYTPAIGDVEKLKEKLNAADIPNLWKPAAQDFYEIDELPMLGSGKLDLKQLKVMAGEKVRIL